MERYSFVNDVPKALELHEDDVIVIGKRMIIDGDERHIAKTVTARNLIKPLADLVIGTADIEKYVDEAKELAKQTKDHALEVSKNADHIASSVNTAKHEANKAMNAASDAREITGLNTVEQAIELVMHSPISVMASGIIKNQYISIKSNPLF